jgi:hypothetical protein
MIRERALADPEATIGGFSAERVLALREHELFPYALWGFLALAAIAIAAILSALAIENDGSARAPIEALRTGGNPDEIARLHETIDTLMAEQQRLTQRVEEFERTQNDLTTSATAGKVTVWGLPPFPYGLKMAPKAALAEPPRQKEAALAPPVPREEAAPPVETTEAILTRTEFALDLGGENTLDGLRARWATLRGNYGQTLDNLRPLVALRTGDQPGSFDFRLVVGPIANAADAARMCASLNAPKITCAVTVFDGQTIELR